MNDDTIKNLFDRLGISADSTGPREPDLISQLPSIPKPAEAPPAAAPTPVAADDGKEILIRGELALAPRAYTRILGQKATPAEILYKTMAFCVSGLAHVCIAIFLVLVIIGASTNENPLVSILLGSHRGKEIEPNPPGAEAAPKKEETQKPPETAKADVTPLPPKEETPAPPVETPPAPGPGPGKPKTHDEAAKTHLESGRSAASRAELLGKYGGNDASESAVENGLTWLATHQSPTGEWAGRDFDRHCPKNDSCMTLNAAGDGVYTHGITSLCVLSYLGAGYTPTSGLHADTLKRALDFLLESQRETGGLDGEYDINLYNHAIATWALCETYGVTRDDKYRLPAQKAIDYLARTQYDGGGWDYYFQRDPQVERNDTSIAGWAVMAMRSGQIAGLTVPETMIAKVKKLIAGRTDPKTGELIYAEKKPGINRKGSGLLAVGLLCRLYLDMQDPVPLKAGINKLVKVLPSWERMEDALRETKRDGGFYSEQNMYTWYYGTLVMFQVGGDYWAQWNKALRDQLCNRQVKKGHKKGSWDPETNYIGREGGRVFSTAINVLNLEIYYRYLPLYATDKKVSDKIPLDPKIDLMELLKKGNQGDQIRAMNDLVRYTEDPLVGAAILEKLADTDLQVRWTAVKALSEMAYKIGLPRMIEVVKGEVTVLQGSMMEYLAKFKDPSTLPLFLEKLTDPQERIREGALTALKTYSGSDYGYDKAAWSRWAAPLIKK